MANNDTNISSGMPHLSEERRARIDAFAPYVSVLPWFNIDVLHKLYINIFAPTYPPAKQETGDEAYAGRAIACADLLQSTWVKRIDYNVFTLLPEKRDALRTTFLDQPEVMKQLGEFMLSYAIACRHQFPGLRYLEVYRIEGNLIVNPLAEADRIAQHVSRQLSRNSNSGNLQPSVAYYLNILDRNDQSIGNETLKTFLKGLDSYLNKDEEQAGREWEQLPDKEQTEGTSITIKLPQKVRRAIVEKIGRPPEEPQLSRSIYAIIVGINDYRQNRLDACINDALAMHEFLQELTEANRQLKAYHPLLLLAPHQEDLINLRAYGIGEKDYQPPTRQGIIDAFQHFRKAKAEEQDICLFYFAGMGAYQSSPLRNEGRLSTLVCLDSQDPGGRDLIDRELTYLLWKTTHEQMEALEEGAPGLHNLFILDSCYSSDDAQPNYSQSYQQTSNTFYNTPATPLKDYLGYEEALSSEKARNAEQAYIQALEKWNSTPVIELAAAQGTENAQDFQKDRRSRGVFTYSLLEVLRKGKGLQLSYSEINRRVQELVKKRVEKQTPQLSVTGSTSNADLTFLNGRFKNPDTYYPVTFDAEQSRWAMQAGATNGIIASSEARGRTIVRVWPVDDPEEYADLEVVEVRTAQSYLAVEEGFDLSPSREYLSEVIRMATAPIRLVPARDMPPRERPGLLERMSSPSLSNFIITENAEQADYAIHILENRYWLTLPDGDIPLFQPSYNFSEFENKLQAVGRWRHLLELNNSQTTIRREEVSMEVEIIEGVRLTLENIDSITPTSFLTDPKEVRITYKNELQPAIRVRLEGADRPYFVSALFLDSLFGITTNLAVEEVRPGEDTWLNFQSRGRNYRTIPMNVDEQYSQLGISEITDYLKIFVSTHEHSVSGWEQDALEISGGGLTKGSSKGLYSTGSSIEEDELYDADDWMSFVIPIHIRRPLGLRPQQIGGEAANELKIGKRKMRVPQGFSAQVILLGEESGVDPKEVEEMASRNSESGRTLLNFISFARDLAGHFEEESREKFSLIELVDIDNATTVNSEQPIVFQSEVPNDGLWTELCYTIDSSGLYIPLAFSDDQGEIRLPFLPEATPDKLLDPDSRAMKKAPEQTVKLFFQWLKLPAHFGSGVVAELKTLG
jgi:hypothetical protein